MREGRLSLEKAKQELGVAFAKDQTMEEETSAAHCSFRGESSISWLASVIQGLGRNSPHHLRKGHRTCLLLIHAGLNFHVDSAHSSPPLVKQTMQWMTWNLSNGQCLRPPGSIIAIPQSPGRMPSSLVPCSPPLDVITVNVFLYLSTNLLCQTCFSYINIGIVN